MQFKYGQTMKLEVAPRALSICLCSSTLKGKDGKSLLYTGEGKGSENSAAHPAQAGGWSSRGSRRDRWRI
eukprot:353724-Chlamydomonas_euryale.AAC.3